MGGVHSPARRRGMSFAFLVVDGLQSAVAMKAGVARVDATQQVYHPGCVARPCPYSRPAPPTENEILDGGGYRH